MYSSLKYSSVKFEILKITTHTDSGTVKVRWRIIGAIGYKALAQFVKEKVLQKKEDNESGVLRYVIMMIKNYFKVIIIPLKENIQQVISV